MFFKELKGADSLTLLLLLQSATDGSAKIEFKE